MQFSKRVVRGLSLSLIVLYGNAITLPAQAAIQQEAFGRPKPGTEGSTKTILEQMRELTRTLKQGENSIATASPNNSALNSLKQIVGKDPASKRLSLEKQSADNILALQSKLNQEASQQLAALKAQDTHIQDKKLPAVIQQRQADAIATIQARQQQLQASLDQLTKAQTNGDDSQRQQALTTLSTQLEQWGGTKEAKTDFNHLPWGSPSSTVRAPINAANIKAMSLQQTKNTSVGQWMALQRTDLNQGHYTPPSLLAKTDPSTMTPQELWDASMPAVGNSNSVGQWQKVAFSGMTTSNQNQWPVLASLPAAVQPADTQATDDVQITPAITQLAASLNHNPAAIYKWVHDNIEYVPTYGSIQGSDMTLQTKRGNAFDTSSLLIALLRTSGIPARYVYGTINVNPTMVKDWVGGVNTTDAAQNLMGQGGIPNIGQASGGVVTSIQMEHVWVEANLNFNPARGGVQQGATNPSLNNNWIPLDASYKSHTRTAGINLAKAVPFDANGLVTSAQQGATIDNTTGSVQNLNQANINSAITNYQTQVSNYLTQNNPNATVGTVIGTSTINPYQSQMLSPTLPYVVNAVVSDYQALPDTMRSFFVATVYADNNGDVAFTTKISTASLKGQPLALSFNPSTAADESTIESYLPKPHADGTPIQASELPTSLPGYLINMTPSITLNGQTLQTGGSFQMGSNIPMQYGFQSPDGKNTPLATKVLNVGEYYAIGYNLQGMSQQQLQNTQTTLQQTQAAPQSQNQTQIATLTKDTVTGAILQMGVQSYFATNQAQDKIASSQANIVSNPYMTYGTFSTNLQSTLSWGVPTKVSFAGMMMDIDHIYNALVEKDNNNTNWVTYNTSRGPNYSANEHLVPESLFNTPNTTPNVEGISAVKALQIAASQGQKVYTINQSNINSALSNLQQSSSTLQAISDAVAAGQIVTISQSTITENGWTGAGYTVIDPNTGSGAYMIAGANGGLVKWIGDNQNAIALILGILAVCTVGASALVFTVALAITVFFAFLITVYNNAHLTWAGCGSSATYTNSVFNFLALIAGIYFGGTRLLAGVAASLGWVYTAAVSSNPVQGFCSNNQNVTNIISSLFG